MNARSLAVAAVTIFAMLAGPAVAEPCADFRAALVLKDSVLQSMRNQSR